MLKARVLTALVLLPLLLAAIWYLPVPWLYAVLSAAGLIVAWEWAGLMGLVAASQRAAYAALMAACLAAGWWARAQGVAFAALALVWWLYAVVLIVGYPANFERTRPSRPSLGIVGIVMLVPTLLSLAALRGMDNGALRLIYLFFVIFAADTGAYFAGRRFGRHKLAPSVSPAKTVEGLIGGLATVLLWSALAGPPIFHLESVAGWLMLAALSLVVALASVVGDLTESLFKRSAGVKDSGHILPGHGGMLDRVDSLLAGAPVMALGLWLTGL
jgi:phosphatidate cytidylyltransferase